MQTQSAASEAENRSNAKQLLIVCAWLRKNQPTFFEIKVAGEPCLDQLDQSDVFWGIARQMS